VKIPPSFLSSQTSVRVFNEEAVNSSYKKIKNADRALSPVSVLKQTNHVISNRNLIGFEL
jgi:hypothetical protein